MTYTCYTQGGIVVQQFLVILVISLIGYFRDCETVNAGAGPPAKSSKKSRFYMGPGALHQLHRR